MNEVCEAHCKYPCHETLGFPIWGTEIYTYDSPICKSAVHSLHISSWNASARSVIIRRIPYNSGYYGSVRLGFPSLSYGTLRSSEYGSFIFLNPKITEDILDVTSIHHNYLFENGENHTQVCIVASIDKSRNVFPKTYLGKNSIPNAIVTEFVINASTKRYKTVWPGWLGNISAGGYQCIPEKSMLSNPTSIAMRKDADFVPFQLTVTANINETVVLKIREARKNSFRIKWKKDLRDLNAVLPYREERNQLTLFNVQVGSSGIYSLEYVASGSTWKRGIIKLIVRACPANYFGNNCTRECPICQNGGICHDVTGVCICPPGFNGTLCENACPPGYFGKDCTMDCDVDILPRSMSCSGYLICLPDPYGCSCAAGFNDLSCTASCENGTYGAGCTQKCSNHSKNNVPCDKFSGICLDGCKDGWHGIHCTISYPVLKHPPGITNVTKHSIALIFREWTSSVDNGSGYPASYIVMFKVVMPSGLQHTLGALGSMVNLTMKETSNNSVWRMGPHIQSTNQSEYSVTLEGLKAGILYNVGIVVIDKSGEMQSENMKTIDILTICDKPDSPPVNVDIQATASAVSIKWELPPRSLWNCDALWSVVRFASSVESKDIKVEETSYSFPSKPFTLWKIQICVTLSYDSEFVCAKEVNITTEESAPEKVSEIVASDITSQTAVLSWTEPTIKNGIVRYYLITYFPKAWVHYCLLPVPQVVTTQKCNATFIALRELHPSVFYSIEISAFTVLEGPKVSIGLQTKGNVPSGTAMFVAYSLEDSHLSWKSPLCNTTSGIIISYFVSLFGIDHWHMSEQQYNVTGTYVSLSGLLPFTNYLVRIFAVNAFGRSKNNSGFIFRTKPGVPLAPTDIVVYSRFSNALYLSWQPPYPPNGNLSYYDIRYSSDADDDEVMEKLGVANATCTDRIREKHHCYSATGLKSNRIYQFKIKSYNEKIEEGSQIVYAKAETKESVPEFPASAAFSERTDKGICVYWDQPRITNGNITNYRVNITVVKPFHLSDASFAPAVESMETSDRNFTVNNLVPATTYSMCVEARTKVGYGPSLCHLFNTSNSVPEVQILPELLHISDRVVFLRIAYTSFSGGPLSAYFIIVDPLLPNSRERRKDIFQPYNCSGYAGTLKTKYVAAKIKDVPEDGLIVAVGDGSCQNGYYNAELEAGVLYRIGLTILSIYGNEEKYSDIKYILETIIVSEKLVHAESYHSGIVLGILIPFLVIIAVVIAYIYYKKPHWINIEKHRRLLHLKIFPTDQPPLGSLNEALEEEEIEIDEIETESTSGDFSNQVLVKDLEEYVQKSLLNGAIKKEYMNLPKGLKFPCTVAKIPENKIKNRYGNLLPYDHSRVVLDKLLNEPFSDYINANYISGYKNTKGYIATQGPKSRTTSDFWRMVWQEQCSKIIMVTNLMESGKIKCEKYWPDGHYHACDTYGDLTVTFIEIEPYADFVIRRFTLTKDQIKREVKHFHFQTWPDHGVPMYVSPIIVLLKKVQQYKNICVGPIIVHCSAGIGRTGTLILLDSMLNMGRAEECVDLFGQLNTMRSQRCNIVVNIDQYIFVYNSVVENLCGLDTCIPCSEVSDKLKYLRTVDAESGFTPIEKEFQMLLKQKQSLSYIETKTACLPENHNRNRNPDILTIDRARPILSQHPNYINAVYVNGYRQRDAFLVTQYPLPNTIEDFWCMIYETKSRTIILLNEINFEDVSCPYYWPIEVESCKTFGKYQIECQTFEKHDNISVWCLKLSCITSVKEALLSVNLLQLHGWDPEQQIPKDPDTILSLFTRSEKRQQQIGQHVVTVQCLDGASACGIFCAIVFICEKMKTEQDLDVFQAVKSIRVNRSGLIQTAEQYNFLYDVALAFLDLFETYANFH